jgi:alpha-mannosidase
MVPAEPVRVKLLHERAGIDLECCMEDVPAFGWKRVVLRKGDGPAPEERSTVTAGSADAASESAGVRIEVRSDGTVDVAFGERRFAGLLGVEDVGDRGDSYDFDAVGEDATRLEGVAVERFTHEAGIAGLRVERRLSVPARLGADRTTRSEERATLRLVSELRLARGVSRVDVALRLWNGAEDHRLRLLFPVGAGIARCDASTTFDVAQRGGPLPDDAGWVQRAVPTFPQQGFVHANGLSVAAFGLPEAELLEAPEGSAIAITLLRAVGNLSRHDLRTRPGPAGPGTETPGAQCRGELRARLSLFPGLDASAARDAELPLRAVPAGSEPLAPEGAPLLSLESSGLVLSALKPAEQGAGLVVRVLNPSDEAMEARLRLGFPFTDAESVRLDEKPVDEPLFRDGETLRFRVPPHALRGVHVW